MSKQKKKGPGYETPKNFYICDPNKNIKCRGKNGAHCGYPCFCTVDPEYATDPNHPLSEKEYDVASFLRRNLYANRVT